MWKKINNSYFLQCRSKSGKKSVFVTDFVKVWSYQFSDAEFLNFLKESNFILVNIDNAELLKNGIRTLCKPEETNSTVNIDGGVLKISMSAEYGYPFTLELNLSEGSVELFFQMVTQPLLKSVSDLRSSESELVRELQKKDKEIEEYKAEGGKIALKHLKTRPFSIETHTACHSVYEENFSSSSIPQNILDKQVIDIEIKHELSDNIKIENDEPSESNFIKIENADTTESVTIKEEPLQLNQVIKAEPDTQSQSIISPRKTQKRKLIL